MSCNDISSYVTDPWNSETSTDIWEMADNPDPFSVDNMSDNTITSLLCNPKIKDNALLISIGHDQNPIPIANLSGQFSDSDDCSDYELHSIDVDDDSDGEGVINVSGAARFQFVDPVAEMLDSVVHGGILPKEHI